jgi:hypothetical protein
MQWSTVWGLTVSLLWSTKSSAIIFIASSLGILYSISGIPVRSSWGSGNYIKPFNHTNYFQEKEWRYVFWGNGIVSRCTIAMLINPDEGENAVGVGLNFSLDSVQWFTHIMVDMEAGVLISHPEYLD